MAYEFSDYIRDELYIKDPAKAADVATALNTLYTEMVGINPHSISETAQAIKVQQALLQLEHDLRPVYNASTGQRPLLYRIQIERDIDFRGGDRSYSVAPRLLFKVPAARRDANATAPVVLEPSGKIKAPGLTAPVTTDNTVLIYPNQEGPQPKTEERPVVQNCAVSPGDFVIVGRVGMAGRQIVWQAIKDVMHPPEDANAFAYFDEHGTVEDLGDILQKMRAQGLDNQYNTGDAYRKRLEVVPALPDLKEEAAQISGFYAKPQDKTEATVRYIPGDVLLVGSGQAMETITGGGFALYEDSAGTERYAPLSRAYARLCMLFKRSSEPVEPERQAAPMKFKPDHPLHDFSLPVAHFLSAISDINKKYAVTPAPSAAANAPGLPKLGLT